MYKMVAACALCAGLAACVSAPKESPEAALNRELDWIAAQVRAETTSPGCNVYDDAARRGDAITLRSMDPSSPATKALIQQIPSMQIAACSRAKYVGDARKAAELSTQEYMNNPSAAAYMKALEDNNDYARARAGY